MMIITICGFSGSGKDTVGKDLAERLGYRFYSVGGIRREMARKRGMSIEEFNELGEREEFTDKEPDQYQEELGRKEDNFVIAGRTSAYFIPRAFKVFLRVELGEAARRIMQDIDNREDESYSSLEEARKAVKKRDESDRKRYMKYYGINPYDESMYDLVIDTTSITANHVVDLILKEIRKTRKP